VKSINPKVPWASRRWLSDWRSAQERASHGRDAHGTPRDHQLPRDTGLRPARTALKLQTIFIRNNISTSRIPTAPFPILLLIVAMLLTGCDNTTTTQAPHPTVPPGPCVIRGIVHFIGTPPDPQTIGGNCCPGALPVLDESLTVNADGSMKNVIVYLQDGPNIDLGELPDRVLAQKDCQYVPHVLAVRTNQTVVVTNHDPTLHNVLTQSAANPQQNIEEIQGAAHSFNFAQPELIKLKCSVHPWMTGYVYVFDHPCFAVTGDDGKFEIGHLPPGTYTLVIWQEKLGTQQMQVTVSADKPAEVKFEYRET
jgi:hypothetical protein